MEGSALHPTKFESYKKGRMIKMFGMEKKESKTQQKFLFDIEKDLASDEKRKELAKRIETRIHRIKEILRTGSKKEDFDHLGILLNGYHALAIVLGRACQAPKK